MNPCFGPLGGICAFTGAVGLILVIFCGLFCLMASASNDGDTLKIVFPPFVVGGMLLLLCLVLGFINQTLLPNGC